MRSINSLHAIHLSLVLIFTLAGCSTASTPTPAPVPTAVPLSPPTSTPPPTVTPTNVPPTATPIPTVVIAKADGLLADILSRGLIVISTDPDFAPQSFSNPAGQRPANTKCAADQLVSNELQGFDIDVSIQISLRLGVEPCFVTPSFNDITPGHWHDKWDISVGSMSITQKRTFVLAFTSPYYYTDKGSPLGIAVDRSHTLSIRSLVKTLDQVVVDMHSDGTLVALSAKWFDKDLTQKPSS